MTAVLTFIVRNQFMLGLLAALFLFLPWKKRRRFFLVRIAVCLAGAICLSMFARIAFPYGLLVHFAVVVALCPICFECRPQHTLFVATCAYCVQHMTSKLAYIVFALWRDALPGFVFPNYYYIVTMLLFAANLAVDIPVFCLFKRQIPGKLVPIFDSTKILVATVMFLLMAVFVSSYVEAALDKTSDGYLTGYCCLNFFCIMFGFLILLTNFMNCRSKRLEEEKYTLEQLLRKDKLQYEQAKLNMERINIRYHDIKQQYGCGAAECENVKLDSEIKSFKTLYYTGNKAVDITLSEKAAVCVDADIQFVCSVDGSCLDVMKPFHIYSLLGNAIDNAVESLAKVADEEKKVVRLDIGKRGKMSVIRIENYISEKPPLVGGLPVTTKADKENHGFGIKSIKNVVEEYNGLMYIAADNNIFTLAAMIPAV